MGTIEVNNYDPYNFVPRGIVNLAEGKGLPSAADEPRRVCLIGMSLFPDGEATGSPLAPKDRPVRVTSERPVNDAQSRSSAEDLFGLGSELYLMCRAAFQAYPGVELYGVPIEEPPEPVWPLDIRARANLTVTGAAKRVGEWTLWLHNTPITVRIEGGYDAYDTCAAIVRALEAHPELPILEPLTGDIKPGDPSTTNVLTLRAKHRGVNGNLIDLYRRGGVAGQALVTSRFLDGDEVADIGQSGSMPSGALGALATQRYHYLVVNSTDSSGTASNLVHLKEHLVRSAEPIAGLRQQGLYGWIGDLDSAVGDGAHGTSHLNVARLQCVWSQGNSLPPAELAAAVASHRAWMEGFFAAANTAGQVVVGVPRPRLPTDLPDAEVLDRALHAGLTPLDIKSTEMALVRSITTRHLDGDAESYTLLDTIKVTVSDFVADDLALKLQARFGGFKLAPDTDVAVPARTATPLTVRQSIVEWLRQYEAAGLLRQVNEHLEEVRVEISADVDGRIDFELPESVVDICAVTAGNLIRF